MFADVAIVFVFAGIGAAIVYFLFASVSHVPVEAKAAKAEKPVVAVKKVKPTKSDLKKKEQEEKELDALVAREATSSRGMHSAKFEVETLESHREKLVAKKSGKGGAVAEAKKEFSEEEKLKERASGFKVVTKEEPKIVAKPASPTQAHSGTRSSGSPKVSAMSAREELDRKLSQFFKANSGKKKSGGNDYDPVEKKETKPVKQGMRVDIKKTISAAEDPWSVVDQS